MIPWISIQDAKAHHGGYIYDTLEQTNELGIANSSARVLPENTVCLSRTASVGYVVVMGCPMATSQDFVNWVCSKNLHHDFLRYILIAEGKNLLRFASGAVHPTIYFPEVKAFHICYPGLPEQRRIVSILDEAFTASATAKINAQRNRQHARELFESHLQAVFNQYGERWKERLLGDCVQDISTGPFGSVLHRSDYEEGGIPLVNPVNIVGDEIIPNSRKAVGKATAERLGRYALEEKDIVIARRGEIGRCAVVAHGQAGWLCGTGCFLIRTSEKVDPHFLAHLLRSKPYREKLERVAERATMPSISNSDLANLTIRIPPLAQQLQTVALLRSLANETQRLESIYQRKLAALNELKNSLLHQAFSGQL